MEKLKCCVLITEFLKAAETASYTDFVIFSQYLSSDDDVSWYNIFREIVKDYRDKQELFYMQFQAAASDRW